MNRYLPGVTHAVVSIPTESDAKQNGTTAIVDLCFGQGDNAISGLQYRKADGKMTWVTPMTAVMRGGSWIYMPIFKGELLIEVCKLASAAVARVKKEFGRPGWGKQYLVLKDKVVLQELDGGIA